MIHPRVVVFDLETTGFNPGDGERIIELGAVEVFDGVRVGRKFHSFVNPEGRASAPGALEVHGISDESLLDKPTFREVGRTFREFLGEDPPVAHNGRKFDGPFLNFELEKAGIPLVTQPIVDTYLMAVNSAHIAGSKTLDGLLKHYEIDASARNERHGALIDSELLAQVYARLLGLHMLMSEADMAQPARQILVTEVATGADHSWFPRRDPRPASTEEMGRHIEFTAKIKDSIWSRLSQ